MTPLFALLLLFLSAAEPRHVVPGYTALRTEQADGAAGALTTGTGESDSELNLNQIGGDMAYIEPLMHESDANQKRIPRGAKDGSSRKQDQQSPQSYQHPRPYEPDGYFTTPKGPHLANSTPDRHGRSRGNSSKGSVLFHNPLYPVTNSSYGAYAVMLLALILFAMGIVGNLALMCIVWHNYYLKSAWNCILASLAFWDFLVLFFCLPVVVFNELTKRRLLGDLSCRIVPYMEVTSLGVATFSLCALSIDRFHAATSPQPQAPRVEPCQSILAKLSVVWIGSMVLAAPELLLWQLTQEVSVQPGGYVVDLCVRRPTLSLPESVYSLVLTYHEARMWWYFGCYFCLPLLFTLACQLVTRHVVAEEARMKHGSSTVVGGKRIRPSSSDRRCSSTVVALAIVYAVCNLPENVCNIALAYIANPISTTTEALLALIGQFLLFVRCSATPVLFLCLCHSLGQAFMDCCCCCCEEFSTYASSLSSPSSLSPSSTKEEKLHIVSGTIPAIFYDKAKDSSSLMAIGTPC
ncbi:unnamed protein product [Oncorhynchus mykiss]|uniref:G-protein coupled receptors family 1 profile domain-containing protein n=1 Tax=Oncorhynchus mykiss TaxID=8022 RepID=A0A060XV65_ONCMY|nr:unnamed protein product [Oncorhynchus mykiss]